MKYNKTVRLKDGESCLLRNGEAQDGQALLDLFLLTHAETDYLLTYPEENSFTAREEADFLREKTERPDEIELLAFVNGNLAGTAGIWCVGRREKTRHRAGFGVSVAKAYWGRGIGRALTRACIACAKAAGYAQLELEAVAENKAALALYESEGFREYGRNPRGFRSRVSGLQTLILMRLELDGVLPAEEPIKTEETKRDEN